MTHRGGVWVVVSEAATGFDSDIIRSDSAAYDLSPPVKAHPLDYGCRPIRDPATGIVRYQSGGILLIAPMLRLKTWSILSKE